MKQLTDAQLDALSAEAVDQLKTQARARRSGLAADGGQRPSRLARRVADRIRALP
ncbi:hypothetical protein [Aquabacterium sp.]|uniref:hypothetical protein n=1 Tax=Aquabacterium sp. TaxID=1872578 RepID=UPI002BD1D479|nr:hypothetical protein [Aquabacterium sp.]HSW03032.1 hypothetical protein [Aquabacterium sp.]